MHHFRGLLRDGNEPRLDPANVYIEYLGPQDGTKANWNGYLLVPNAQAVRPGNRYTLELNDGRSGDLDIVRIDPDPDPDPETPGQFRALFSGETPLK